MYDMYPDWGPAGADIPDWALRPEPRPRRTASQLQLAFNGPAPTDPRDDAWSRPDDN